MLLLKSKLYIMKIVDLGWITSMSALLAFVDRVVSKPLKGEFWTFAEVSEWDIYNGDLFFIILRQYGIGELVT